MKSSIQFNGKNQYLQFDRRVVFTGQPTEVFWREYFPAPVTEPTMVWGTTGDNTTPNNQQSYLQWSPDNKVRWKITGLNVPEEEDLLAEIPTGWNHFLFKRSDVINDYYHLYMMTGEGVPPFPQSLLTEIAVFGHRSNGNDIIMDYLGKHLDGVYGSGFSNHAISDFKIFDLAGSQSGYKVNTAHRSTSNNDLQHWWPLNENNCGKIQDYANFTNINATFINGFSSYTVDVPFEYKLPFAQYRDGQTTSLDSSNISSVALNVPSFVENDLLILTLTVKYTGSQDVGFNDPPGWTRIYKPFPETATYIKLAETDESLVISCTGEDGKLPGHFIAGFHSISGYDYNDGLSGNLKYNTQTINSTSIPVAEIVAPYYTDGITFGVGSSISNNTGLSPDVTGIQDWTLVHSGGGDQLSVNAVYKNHGSSTTSVYLSTQSSTSIVEFNIRGTYDSCPLQASPIYPSASSGFIDIDIGNTIGLGGANFDHPSVVFRGSGLSTLGSLTINAGATNAVPTYNSNAILSLNSTTVLGGANYTVPTYNAAAITTLNSITVSSQAAYNTIRRSTLTTILGSTIASGNVSFDHPSLVFRSSGNITINSLNITGLGDTMLPGYLIITPRYWIAR